MSLKYLSDRLVRYCAGMVMATYHGNLMATLGNLEQEWHGATPSWKGVATAGCPKGGGLPKRLPFGVALAPRFACGVALRPVGVTAASIAHARGNISVSWMAVRTKGGRENYTKGNIERLGHETYLPICRNWRTRVVEPLFPRYLFVRKTDQWWNLRTTWGVICIVRRAKDAEPDTMQDRVIEEIQAREDERGLVRLDLPGFRPGSRVKTVGGAMVGYLGIYQGMSRHERCEVLYNMLGSSRLVSVPMEYLRTA
jgi:transcription antitermination factor NusG